MLISLFTQLPLSLSSGFIIDGIIMAGIEVMHGFKNMNFHSPRLTWQKPLLSAQSSSNRDQHRTLDIAPFSGVISQIPGGRLITLDNFHHGKGGVFSYWNR